MNYSYTFDAMTSGASQSPWLTGVAFLASGFGILISVALWVYMSYAFMVIAQKTNYPTPAIAWIPGIGPLIIASQVAKMHWWPILLILLFWIPIIKINFIAMIVLVVYGIIWMWKVAEARNRPGWWGLIVSLGNIIPIIGGLVSFVFLGMLAWAEAGGSKPKVPEAK